MHLHQGAEPLVLRGVLLITLKENDVLAFDLAEFPYSHPVVRQEKEHLVSDKGIPVGLGILLALFFQPLTNTPSE